MTDPLRASVTREGDTIVIRIPADRAHKLRVELAPCPCRGAKATEGVETRAALADAIGRAAR